MKYILTILFLLLTSNVYAGGQQTLVTPDGRVLGTASNPLVVTGGGGGSVSDTVYGVGWNGDTTVAPSKNAIYDKIETMGGGLSNAAQAIYNVKDYGALGDGIYFNDGAVTSTTTAFTSASATFTAGDVGKVITIEGAGAAGVDLTTTIAAYVSATAVTLTVAASTTVSSASFTYGTDDTVGIQAAIDAVGTAGAGTVFFPKGIYIIDGAFSGSGALAQLTLPNVAVTTSQKTKQIKLKGTVFQQLAYGGPAATEGSILYFTKIGVAGQNGIATYNNTLFFGVHRSNILVQLEQITFRTVKDPAITPVNLENANQMTVSYVNFDHGYKTSTSSANAYERVIQPTGTSSYALKTPLDANHVMSTMDHVEVLNYYYGIQMSDHAVLENSGIYLCVYGIEVPLSNHNVYMGYVSLEANNYNITFTGGISGIMAYGIDIEHVSIGVGNWSTTTADIYDPSNYAYGSFRYWIYGLAQATVNGGTNLKIESVYNPPWEFTGASTIQSAGAVGVYTSTPLAGIDISSGSNALALGADTSGTTRTASTTQIAKIVTPSYATGMTNPVHLINANNSSTDNTVQIGGGVSTAYAATAIRMFTTAATTTVTGTERFTILPSGLIGIGQATPTHLLEGVKSLNGEVSNYFTNVNAGTAAYVGHKLQNDATTIGGVNLYGSGFTGNGGADFANRIVLTSTGGMTLVSDATTNTGGTSTILLKPGGYGQTAIGTVNTNGFRITPPAAQTIAATNTITANACGGIKLITAAGAVTTSTTDTFTAPAAGNLGCIMNVCNTGANNITLDNNANFKSAGGADVVMTQDDCVSVGSTGAGGVWYQLTALEAN